MAESLCCSPITASLINYVVLVQLLNHVQLLPTRLTPGFSVLHHLPEFAQTHVH